MSTSDRFTDRHYLANEQYRDASKLQARMQLHERFSVNPRGWHEWVFDQFEMSERSAVLEVGCGPGRLWEVNGERVPPGWDLTLGDLSPGMLAEARGHLEELGCPLRFERLDAQELPFEDGTFDAVIANHMLYHIPDRPRALGEIERVLKVGGTLYAATNGHAEGPMLPDWLARARVSPAMDRSTGVEGRFNLENGAAQLHRTFRRVELRRYEDALHVTEVEPLVDYVQSGANKLEDGELRRFRSVIAGEIDERGFLLIDKAAGMFVARR